MNYDFDKNRNNSTIQVFPLIYDLRQDFIRDGLGNFVVYYDDTIENILSDIITQYRSTATNPILSIGSLAVTGQNIKYTFNFNNYLEGFNTIIGQFLNANCFVKVDADGVITL